jgi:GNAT superfamily N-acetyltransferase
MEIRDLTAADRAAWNPLWEDYLRFYREDLAPEITDLSFARLSARRDGCFALVAVADDGALAGFAHCVLHATTWSRGGTCYLEDLFVDPAQRGTGTARALIEAAAQRGRTEGAQTLYWQTQAYNGRARSLYDHVGRLTSSVLYEREL